MSLSEEITSAQCAPVGVSSEREQKRHISTLINSRTAAASATHKSFRYQSRDSPLLRNEAVDPSEYRFASDSLRMLGK